MEFRKPRLVLFGISALALASVASTSGAIQGQPLEQSQGQPQKPPYTLAEYLTASTDLFDHLITVPDPQDKIKLLDDFTVRYPAADYPARAASQTLALSGRIYREYFLAYFSLRDYPRALNYLDKLIALGDVVPIQGRNLQDLIVRAQIYLLHCADDVLATHEAYARTKDSAAKGLQALNQPEGKPSGLTDDEFAERKKNIEMLFNSELAIAESGLHGDKSPNEACKAAPDAVFALEGVSFDQMIDDIKSQKRQEPRVR
jgi:hypothetical protein